MKEKDIIYFQEEEKKRIDLFLAAYLSFSRTKIVYFIENNTIKCNGKIINKSNFLLKKNDFIQYDFTLLKKEKEHTHSIFIEIVYDHHDFIIINKPPFITVHETNKNNKEYTIADWIKENNIFSGIAERAGIIHRLDNQTSGLLLIAKNDKAVETLTMLFKSRVITKKYYALLTGSPPLKFTVDNYIKRDPLNPTKMINTLSTTGKKAITYFEQIKGPFYRCIPHTGRTHQIRVHAAYVACPLWGDTLYGNSYTPINRHALHAYHLSFVYNNEQIIVEIPLADDINSLIKCL